MKIELQEIKVRDLVEGYADNQENGIVGYGGRLDIRPPYQREFVYGPQKRAAVIETLTHDFPLNVMYWAVREDGGYEVIDGQQRIISICQYVTGDFSVWNDYFQAVRYFHNLQDRQEQILNYKLKVYFCEGTPSEKLKWFETINIAGEKLTDQELRNAVYHGSWVSDAKRYFSKTECAAYKIGNKYVSGIPIRQEYLETVIKWISGAKTSVEIEDYMSKHQHDPNANELWDYFQAVIDWVSGVFTDVEKEMCGLEWGRLYETYHKLPYDASEVAAEVKRLYADPYVKNRKGVFEYILGGSVEARLLDVRVFDEATKRAVYARQTTEAEATGVSNCPLCAIGHDANRERIWKLSDMDADHVAAWSKGGATDIANCQMLCKTHNRAKGNR
jgi:5-methylcytosine-specific restriction endonuclease McrA